MTGARRWGPLVLALVLVDAVAGSSPIDDELRAGQIAMDAGDLPDALTHFATARTAAKRAADVPAQIDAALREATAHRALGQLHTAGEVLDIADGLADGDAIREADVLVGRGMLALDSGEPRAAEKAFRRAFEEFRAANDPQGAANAAVDLGLAQLHAGHDADALKAFRAAAVLFEALGDAKGRADALVNVGIALRRAGNPAEARAQLETALELYATVADEAGQTDALGDLALVVQDLGDVAHARDLYDGALATARARKDLPRQAALLQDLGTLEHGEGRVKEAASDYAAAQQLYTDLGRHRDALAVAIDGLALTGGTPTTWASVVEQAKKTGDLRLVATAYLDLAAAQRTSNPVAAKKAADTARTLADTLELRPVRWRARYVGALIDSDAGRDADALAALREAVSLLDETRASLAGADTQEFVAAHEDVYRALIDALIRAGKADEAAVVAEELHVQALPDTLPEGDPLVDQFRALDEEQRWVEDQLSTVASTSTAAAKGTDDERTAALRERLAVLRVDFSKAVDDLRAAHPELNELVRVEPEDLEAVQAQLEPGVVVVEPVLFNDRLTLLVFKRDSVVARTVTVDRAEMLGTLDRLVAGLRAGNTYEPSRTRDACAKLGSWLITPIEDQLEGATTLVIAADGPFRQVPFALLRTEDRWLVERVAIASVTHIGSLDRHGVAQPAFRLDGPGLLLIGNPDGSLPGAEAEVKAIAARFPGAEVLTEAQGTRAALIADGPDKRAIHLATHGTLDPDHPERSWLTLVGPAGEDRLTYREIPGLAPYLGRCRLVVLSACESAVPIDAANRVAGEVQVSIDGLAAQFRRAGVETLVASLWRVDDRATLSLMDQFYAGLGRGDNIAESMRAAQLAMLADRDMSHPWFWAGFVVVGDWR